MTDGVAAKPAKKAASKGKMLGLFGCFVLVVLAIVLPVYFFVILPAQLMQQLKDGINFWPCEVKMLSAAPTVADDGTYTFTECVNDGTKDAAALTACGQIIGARSQGFHETLNPYGEERLGLYLGLKAYNPIDADIDLKVVNLVIKAPDVGMAANTDDVLAETYAAAGSLVSCVMTETTTLEGKKWSELPMHCEIEITDSLAGLFGAFVAGTDLPTVTTFAATADTPLGDKSITGTFDSSDTTDVPTYQMEAGCAAASAFEGNMHLAGYSTHTCWTPGSATFNAILGTCDVTAAIGNDANGELVDFGSGEGTNLGNDNIGAFFCCILKTTDSLDGMLAALLGAVGIDVATLGRRK